MRHSKRWTRLAERWSGSRWCSPRLHSGRLHGGNHRLALSPVRTHDCIFRPPLRLQRAHPQSRARRIATASKEHADQPRSARALLRIVQRRLCAGAKRLHPDLRFANPQGCAGYPYTSGVYGACRRPWKGRPAIVPARRRSRLLSDERPAPAGRFTRAHQQSDAADRRDPEERAGTPLLQCDRRLQHPFADDQQPQRTLFLSAKAIRRAEDGRSAIRGDRR